MDEFSMASYDFEQRVQKIHSNEVATFHHDKIEGIIHKGGWEFPRQNEMSTRQSWGIKWVY